MNATNNTNRANKGNNFNSTNVVGFVATEPKVSTFAEASVVRFALAVRNRKVNKTTGEVTSESSLITVEKWSKNTNLTSLHAIRKGILVEVKGALKPNEWKAADGTSRSRIILGARSVKEVARRASQTEAVESVAVAS